MTDAPLITAEQVATINEARTVLAAIAGSAHIDHDSQASGMIFARASVAANDLFMLLVWASTYGHEPLTKAQIHNDAADDAARDESYHYDLDR